MDKNNIETNNTNERPILDFEYIIKIKHDDLYIENNSSLDNKIIIELEYWNNDRRNEIFYKDNFEVNSIMYKTYRKDDRKRRRE